MIIVLKQDAPDAQVREFCHELQDMGLQINDSKGSDTHILGLIGDTKAIAESWVLANPVVETCRRVSEPYKKANRKFHPDDSVIDVDGVKIGGGSFAVIAGPCSIESEEQITYCAQRVKAAGASLLRGGAFKPRTSPYSFQGMRSEGLDLLKLARRATGAPIVTEIMNTEHLPLFENVDLIQVGARNMQNFELLKAVGRQKKPVLLKRGLANTLEEWCRDNGVEFWFHTRVTGLMTLGGKIFGVRYMNRRGFERKEESARVIVATGGVSYPATGSTGDGYAFAADLGHTIEPLRPSLTPLLSSHAQMRYLDKVLLRNVRATLYVDNEPVREEFGEIGFSDRGIEGAVALRMSRDAVDALIEEKRVKLVLDLKPALTEEVLHERIAREIAELQPNEFFGELLRKLVPKPLVMPLAQEVDIRANCYVGKITEEQITRLVRTLKGLTFPITDYAPFEYAVVTAGGVRCDEVNPYTMESLKVKGLYFAGEVLDIDANTGGYNLQIAFSTGRLAGSLKK